MFKPVSSHSCGFPRKVISAFLSVVFLSSNLYYATPGFAQGPVGIGMLNLPTPGSMVMPSPAFVPVLLKGMTIHPEDPLKFDFIVDSGNTRFPQDKVKEESERLVKYFLASMTVPKNDLWVNLSPHEKDRIIPNELSRTELGRDMLAQDYLLKQLTASMMYPEKELGKKFWKRVYAQAKERFGTAKLPVNTFNKVWILPESATVYENGSTVYVVGSRLKVLTDKDYLATSNKRQATSDKKLDTQSQIIREIIVPEIEREVNEGKHFAPLRQIYHSLILAKWYKETVKNSLLSEVYVDQNKVAGMDVVDEELKIQIYDQYMKAYKKGVFNYIRKDYDELTKKEIPRKYFSGGFTDTSFEFNKTDSALLVGGSVVGRNYKLGVTVEGRKANGDKAMLNDGYDAVRKKILAYTGLSEEELDKQMHGRRKYDPRSLKARSYPGLSVVHNIDEATSRELGLTGIVQELREKLSKAGLGDKYAFVDLRTFHFTTLDLINEPDHKAILAKSGFDYDLVKNEVQKKAIEFMAVEAPVLNVLATVNGITVGRSALKLKFKLPEEGSEQFESFRGELDQFLEDEIPGYSLVRDMRRGKKLSPHITFSYLVNKIDGQTELEKLIDIFKEMNEEFAKDPSKVLLTQGEVTAFDDMDHYYALESDSAMLGQKPLKDLTSSVVFGSMRELFDPEKARKALKTSAIWSSIAILGFCAACSDQGDKATAVKKETAPVVYKVPEFSAAWPYKKFGEDRFSQQLKRSIQGQLYQLRSSLKREKADSARKHLNSFEWELGEDQLDCLLFLLQKADKVDSLNIMEALESALTQKPERKSEILAAFVQKVRVGDRYSALSLLMFFVRNPAEVEAFYAASRNGLEHYYWLVRYNTVEYLKDFPREYPDRMPLLRRSLYDSNGAVRVAAARAVKSVQNRDFAVEGQAASKARVANRMAQIKEDIKAAKRMEGLIQKLEGQDDRILIETMKKLQVFGLAAQTAVPGLEMKLQHKNEKVRTVAKKTLKIVRADGLAVLSPDFIRRSPWALSAERIKSENTEFQSLISRLVEDLNARLYWQLSKTLKEFAKYPEELKSMVPFFNKIIDEIGIDSIEMELIRFMQVNKLEAGLDRKNRVNRWLSSDDIKQRIWATKQIQAAPDRDFMGVRYVILDNLKYGGELKKLTLKLIFEKGYYKVFVDDINSSDSRSVQRALDAAVDMGIDAVPFFEREMQNSVKEQDRKKMNAAAKIYAALGREGLLERSATMRAIAAQLTQSSQENTLVVIPPDKAKEIGDLYAAVERHDLAVIKRFLNKHEDQRYFRTIISGELLHAAKKLGGVDVLALLLEKGARIEEKNAMGATALVLASHCGNIEAVKLLLAKGARVDEKTKEGVTALMLASQEGHVGVVEILFKKGAQVNNKHASGMTPLLSAVFRGHVEVVRLLLEAGAHVNEKTMTGYTALRIARKLGYKKIEALLIKHGAKDNPIEGEKQGAIDVLKKAVAVKGAQDESPKQSQIDKGVPLADVMKREFGTGSLLPRVSDKVRLAISRTKQSDAAMLGLEAPVAFVGLAGAVKAKALSVYDGIIHAGGESAERRLFLGRAALLGLSLCGISCGGGGSSSGAQSDSGTDPVSDPPVTDAMIREWIASLTYGSPTTAKASEEFKNIVDIGERAMPFLIENLRDITANTDTRKWSAYLIGVVGSFDEAFEVLLSVIYPEGGDNYEYMSWHRTEAANGMGQLFKRHTKDFAFSYMTHEYPEVRGAVIYSFIGRLDRDTDDDIFQAITDVLYRAESTYLENAWGSWALKEAADERDIDLFIDLFLNHTNISVREDASEFLSATGDLRTLDIFMDALQNDPSSVIRENAAIGLGLIGDTRAVGVLTYALLNDFGDVISDYVRAAAALSLGQIGAATAIPDLEYARDNDPEAHVRLAAEEAIDMILGLARLSGPGVALAGVAGLGLGQRLFSGARETSSEKRNAVAKADSAMLGISCQIYMPGGRKETRKVRDMHALISDMWNQKNDMAGEHKVMQSDVSKIQTFNAGRYVLRFKGGNPTLPLTEEQRSSPQQVKKPFDYGLFHFDKDVTINQRLFELNINGHLSRVQVNNSPDFDRNFLILPEIKEHLPQLIQSRHIEMLLNFRKIEGDSHLRWGHNSFGAGAIVNNLHIHGFYNGLPIDDAKLDKWIEHNGVTVYELQDYPAKGLVFVSDNSTALAVESGAFVKLMQDVNIPYNVYMNDKGVYVLPRRYGAVEMDGESFMYSFVEMAGIIGLPAEEKLNALAALDARNLEELIEEYISSQSIDAEGLNKLKDRFVADSAMLAQQATEMLKQQLFQKKVPKELREEKFPQLLKDALELLRAGDSFKLVYIPGEYEDVPILIATSEYYEVEEQITFNPPTTEKRKGGPILKQVGTETIEKKAPKLFVIKIDKRQALAFEPGGKYWEEPDADSAMLALWKQEAREFWAKPGKVTEDYINDIDMIRPKLFDIAISLTPALGGISAAEVAQFMKFFSFTQYFQRRYDGSMDKVLDALMRGTDPILVEMLRYSQERISLDKKLATNSNLSRLVAESERFEGALRDVLRDKLAKGENRLSVVIPGVSFGQEAVFWSWLIEKEISRDPRLSGMMIDIIGFDMDERIINEARQRIEGGGFLEMIDAVGLEKTSFSKLKMIFEILNASKNDPQRLLGRIKLYHAELPSEETKGFLETADIISMNYVFELPREVRESLLDFARERSITMIEESEIFSPYGETSDSAMLSDPAQRKEFLDGVEAVRNTVALLKPDAVQLNLVDEILAGLKDLRQLRQWLIANRQEQKFHKYFKDQDHIDTILRQIKGKSLKIVKGPQWQMTEEQVREFYEAKAGEPFFEKDLIPYMISGPSIPLFITVNEGKAFKVLRAVQKIIRAKYQVDLVKTLLHTSDSRDTAYVESELLFSFIAQSEDDEVRLAEDEKIVQNYGVDVKEAILEVIQDPTILTKPKGEEWGYQNIAYEVPGAPNILAVIPRIKKGRVDPVALDKLKSRDDPFPERDNIGVVVAQAGDLTFVKKIEGDEYGVPYEFIDRRDQGEVDEGFVNRATGMIISSLETAAEMPQPAFDELAEVLREFNEKGYNFDQIRMNLLVVDQRRFGVQNIERAKHLALNSVYDMVSAFLLLEGLDVFEDELSDESQYIRSLQKKILTKITKAVRKASYLQNDPKFPMLESIYTRLGMKDVLDDIRAELAIYENREKSWTDMDIGEVDREGDSAMLVELTEELLPGVEPMADQIHQLKMLLDGKSILIRNKVEFQQMLDGENRGKRHLVSTIIDGERQLVDVQVPSGINLKDNVEQVTIVLDVDKTVTPKGTEDISSQNLEQIIRAARLIKERAELDIKIILISGSPYKPYVESRFAAKTIGEWNWGELKTQVDDPVTFERMKENILEEIAGQGRSLDEVRAVPFIRESVENRVVKVILARLAEEGLEEFARHIAIKTVSGSEVATFDERSGKYVYEKESERIYAIDEQLEIAKALSISYLTNLGAKSGKNYEEVIDRLKNAGTFLGEDGVEAIFDEATQGIDVRFWPFNSETAIIFHDERGVDGNKVAKEAMELLMDKQVLPRGLNEYNPNGGGSFTKISLFEKGQEISNAVGEDEFIVAGGDSLTDDNLWQPDNPRRISVYFGRRKEILDYESVMLALDIEGKDLVRERGTETLLENLMDNMTRGKPWGDFTFLNNKFSPYQIYASLPEGDGADNSMLTKEKRKEIWNNRKILVNMLQYPSDFDWESNKKQIPKLDGVALGKTNTNGTIALQIAPYFRFEWKVLGFAEEGWKVVIEEGRVKNKRYEIVVKSTKQGKKAIIKTFLFGGFTDQVNGAQKEKGNKIEKLVIDEYLGKKAVINLMQKPRAVSWKKYTEKFPYVKYLPLGETDTNGTIRLFFESGFFYRWSVLGFNEKGWDVVIKDGEIKNEHYELTVSMTKKGKKSIVRTFQVGPFTQKLEGNSTATDGKTLDVLMIGIESEVGKHAIEYLIKKPQSMSWKQYTQQMPDIKGLLLGETDTRGTISVSMQNYQYRLPVLGFLDKGWKAVIVAAAVKDEFFHLYIELSKDGQKRYRHFQIGKYMKSLKGALDKKGTKKDILNIIDVDVVAGFINRDRAAKKSVGSRAEGMIYVEDNDYNPLDMLLSKEVFQTIDRVLSNFDIEERKIAFDIMKGNSVEDIASERGCSIEKVNKVRYALMEGLENFKEVYDLSSQNNDLLADPGGIDMNNIEVDREGSGVTIQFDPAQLEDIEGLEIDGFVPVIINITPVPNILPLLGLEPALRPKDIELSSAAK